MKTDGNWQCQEDKELYKLQVKSQVKIGYVTSTVAPQLSIHPSKQVQKLASQSEPSAVLATDVDDASSADNIIAMNVYLNDKRTPCKYGEKCYQKNAQHHKRFKHPQEKKEKEENINDVTSDSPPAKKLKLNDSENNSYNENARVTDSSREDEKSEQSTEVVKEIEKEDIEESIHEISDEDEDILPSSPLSVKENIKQKFLVDMPQDFYDFWDLCHTLNKENPEDAFCLFGLKLVGAFDILSEKLKGIKIRKLNQYLCHWRFYYDPPEFQTVIVGEKDEFHMGYFRDDPSEDPVFVASISSSKSGTIHPMKEDLFSSVYSFIKDNCKDDPKKVSMLKSLKSFAEEKNYKLDTISERLKSRKKKIVSKSFHGAGIVVPVDKETDVGYREIPETTTSLKKILKNVVNASTKEKKLQTLEVLQELMTNAQWATDEGDFGMGLELGINLFTYGGKDFHSFIEHLLTVAYDLLKREAFAKIIKAHLRNRRKGSNMSAFENQEKN